MAVAAGPVRGGHGAAGPDAARRPLAPPSRASPGRPGATSSSSGPTGPPTRPPRWRRPPSSPSAPGATIEVVAAHRFLPTDQAALAAALHAAAHALRERGLHVRERLGRGDPALVLTDVAADEDARLIVVGAGERGKTARRLIGSVADSVAERASCDVLIVRPRDGADPAGRALGRGPRGGRGVPVASRPPAPYAAAMTSRADFTDDEWTRLKRAPFVAGLAVSIADPGGPIEAVKETAATLRTVVDAAQGEGRGDLVAAIARDVGEDTKHHHNPLSGFRPKGALAAEQVLDELREVNAIVAAKADPDDAAAFRAWLLAVAQAAADAAKEGGFLGFHAVRVSEGEQRMLDKLAEALAAPAA